MLTENVSAEKGAISMAWMVAAREVMRAVAKVFKVNIRDLLGFSKKWRVMLPRHVAAYLLREDLKRSFPTIAADLNRKNHTTAMNSWRQIGSWMENDLKLQRKIATVRARYKPKVTD